MVTREPEWDDDERDRLLGLALYESGLCECGLHQMQLDDPVNHPHTIETTMCKVCAAIETHQRVQADEDAKAVERLGKRPSPKVARPTDGRRVFLRPAPVSALAGDGN